MQARCLFHVNAQASESTPLWRTATARIAPFVREQGKPRSVLLHSPACLTPVNSLSSLLILSSSGAVSLRARLNALHLGIVVVRLLRHAQFMRQAERYIFLPNRQRIYFRKAMSVEPESDMLHQHFRRRGASRDANS